MKISCGLLLFRRAQDGLEVLLVHPGGPYWRGKDEGAWSIPKGLQEAGEEALAAAKREFHEETGLQPNGFFTELTPVKQRSGKLLRCWAIEGDPNGAVPGQSHFELEWPPKSGVLQSFPEVDAVRMFSLREAMRKIHAGQAPLLDQLKVLAAR